MLVLKSLMEPGVLQIRSGRSSRVSKPKVRRAKREKRSFFADFEKAMGAGMDLIIGQYRL